MATTKNDDLPPLPLTASQYGFKDTPAFSANQMRRYARKALAMREWVDLTPEDKAAIINDNYGGSRLDIMDKVAALLKEKNHVTSI